MDDLSQNHSKEYLEHQYSPSRWSKLHSPDVIIPNHIAIINQASHHARQKTRNKQNVFYGKEDSTTISSGQLMDLFFPSDDKIDFQDGRGSNLLLFIHGGYWQDMCKESYSYFGEIFSKFGVITAVVGYDLAPDVDMNTIYNEMKEAVVYLARRFKSSPLFLSGHSAGGHLVSMLLKENWENYGLSKSLIKGAIAISGVFDLQPLVNTYVNDALKMDLAEAKRLSPMNYIDEVKANSDCNVLCLVGEYESPEFHRQSQEYCKALQDAGIEASLSMINGTDHFSIMHDFLDEDYQGTKLMLGLLEKDIPDDSGIK